MKRHSLERRAEALREIEALLDSAPDETIAEPASFERCALLIEAGSSDAARPCLESYLTRFSGGPHAGEAAILLGRMGPATTLEPRR